MRVLIVNPRFFVYGGAELLIVELCRNLARNNIEHALLTTAIVPEVARELGGTRVIVAPCAWDPVRIYYDLWRAVRKYAAGYDVVNVHNFPAEFSAFLSRRPVVWMCNEPELYLRKINTRTRRGKLLGSPVFLLERWIVRNCIRKSVVSDSFNARRFKSLYGVEPQIVHYGIDHDFFSARDEEAVRRLKSQFGGRFVVLHAGMMTPLKNQMRSLQALRGIRERVPDCLLVLAGSWDDAYKAQLDVFIAANRLAGNVLFTGHVDRLTLRNYYQACDVLLHPVGSQGGWLAPFEALCAGLPVVTAPEMTASDIITREQIGVVTADYETEMARAFENPAPYKAMAGRGGKWVRENLSWEKFSAGMLAAFNSALACEKSTSQ
jgi:glycosyltransferase involved in cell wall biosynthesis